MSANQPITIDSLCGQIDAINITATRLIDDLQRQRNLLRDACTKAISECDRHVQQSGFSFGKEDPRRTLARALSLLHEIDKVSPLSTAQIELQRQHGTVEEFTDAVINAIGEISVAEAQVAIAQYRVDWALAGK